MYTMNGQRSSLKDGRFLGAEPLAEPFVHILGIRFHRVAMTQAVELILYWIAEKSRRMVITAGPEFVMKTHHDEILRRITQSADLVTADGIGIVWAAARSGRPVPERVTGVELATHLFEEATRRHQSLRVYMLGATEEALQNCLRTFRTEYPSFTFAGRNGYFGKDEVENVIAGVYDFAPDIWLVGLGQPNQEKLIYENLAHLPPCVGIGVGGSIDVWGGTVKRAPEVIQKLNLEWLFRLMKEPSRIRRQMALPMFAWDVLKAHKRPDH
jgi:N-acetylglucosaminyldiphosphoundecaprenol N-acetyl-beta-D-mannosaminyltransferase